MVSASTRPTDPVPEIEPESHAQQQATYAKAGERLPLNIKLAYGMPNLAGAGMAIPVLVTMTIFYSDVVLLPLGFVALAIAFARAFDAITDPIMGWITDRTNTRWGRRRPCMLIGAPLCAISFFLLFNPPESLSVGGAGIWFCTTFILYYLFHTMYSIPHYGLGPELAEDYHERSSLFAVMEGFAVLGTILGAALPALCFSVFGGQREGFRVFALGVGIVLTLLYAWQCYKIRERPDYYTREPNPIVPGVRRVMRNRPARILLATYTVGSVTGMIPALMMPYFTTYVLKVEDPAFWIAALLVIYFGSGLVLLPFWLRATRRFGKYPIYIVTAAVGISSSIMLFFQGPGDVVRTALILAWAGTVFGARLFLGPSIQADVIDYDELYTGKRREAQYGAFWALITKFTVIPSAAVPLAILATLGYQPNVEQTETVTFAIRLIYGVFPATFGLLSLVVFTRFPIREITHQKILEGIGQHRRGESAEDPLTGRVLQPPASDEDEERGWFLDHFSYRELVRTCKRGPRVLIQSATLAAAFSLFTASLFGWLVWSGLGDLNQKPGLSTTLEVVVAGFAFTGFCYHLLRLRAARKMNASPVHPDLIRSHLELLESRRPIHELAPAANA
jgi:GPH family glycoside/pentoside/hexuronide:cation symporter